MNRILVLGGSGILGSELCRLLEESNIDYSAPRSRDLDIRNRELLFNYVNDYGPNWIVNCAAWTNVEAAEENFSASRELNEMAVSNLVAAAKNANCFLIHISTDYVFDGNSTKPYSETSRVNPINKYGESKLRGEKILLSNYGDYCFVVRTSWLYGAKGKNFVKSVALKALREEQAVVVDDQIGSPTNSKDLAHGLVSIIHNPPKPGIYHYSNQGECSWFELAQFIYQAVGKDSNLVQPIKSDRINFKAKRPLYSLLSKAKWESRNVSELYHWKESLRKALPKIIDELRQEGAL